MNALIQVAEEAAGDDTVCVNVTKLPEGNFNNVFLVTMRDGKEVVAKISNPNARLGGYGTASEVATMKYAREDLGLLAPKVLKYCSRVDRSELGAEYIVMENVRGVELGRVWERLKGRDKLSIVKQVASITSKLARARFPGYGLLYLREDVEEDESIRIDDTFAIGPTTGSSWFDDRRWTSPTDTINALSQREIACQHKFPTPPEIPNKAFTTALAATIRQKKQSYPSSRTS